TRSATPNAREPSWRTRSSASRTWRPRSTSTGTQCWPRRRRRSAACRQAFGRAPRDERRDGGGQPLLRRARGGGPRLARDHPGPGREPRRETVLLRRDGGAHVRLGGASAHLLALRAAVPQLLPAAVTWRRDGIQRDAARKGEASRPHHADLRGRRGRSADLLGGALSRYPNLDYCYLTTRGRVSGNPHTIESWYGAEGDTLYLLSG